MAFGRLERTRGSEPMSEINMTPLIDVMLVLLIIFMITAPMMTSRLKLDLPRADAKAPPPVPPAVLTIALTADGRTHLDEQAITAEALAVQVEAQARQKPDTEVQLRADRVVPYERVAQLIGLLQKVGLNRIAFVTEGPAEGVPAQPAAPAAP
ncbi:MAG: biopolymer transporter ExbD [Burkholderiales bacterium]|nr:biopolymer transporter ExbD [Burkholderiales bacterium]MBH2016531.1 biopolymer transporter ExbD [Burkholderiales bacterium]